MAAEIRPKRSTSRAPTWGQGPRWSTLIETFGEPRLAESTAWPTITAGRAEATPRRDKRGHEVDFVLTPRRKSFWP